MEPNKFEEHIKKQLRQREIHPSADAWERLSENLENNGKSGKKNYFRYGIAASFIGLLIASVLYFNYGNAPETPNDQIVDTPKDTNPFNEADAINDIQANETTDNVVAVDSTKPISTKEIIVLNASKEVRKRVEPVAENRLELVDPVNHKIQLPSQSAYKAEEILNAKIREVVARVNSLEKENIDLTDAEVDSLLRQAQTELTMNNRIQNGNKVDPMALLTDVEDQLDRSFRDKLFDRLKAGFVKVRTAVADSDR